MHAATFAGGIKFHGDTMTISYNGRRASKFFLAIIIGACLQKFFPDDLVLLLLSFVPFGIKLKWSH